MTELDRLIAYAAQLASEVHRDQRRKGSGDPYINHPIEVASGAAGFGLSKEAVIAAYLHDALEDSNKPWDTDKLIRFYFPERAVRLIQLLSRNWNPLERGVWKKIDKKAYYQRILSDPEAIALKLLDRAQNLSDIANHCDKLGDWPERYLKQTDEDFGPLLEACDNHNIIRLFKECRMVSDHAVRKHQDAGRLL